MTFTPEQLLDACRAAIPDAADVTIESTNPMRGNHHEMNVCFARANGQTYALIVRRVASPVTWHSPGAAGRAEREYNVLRSLRGVEPPLPVPPVYAAGSDGGGEWLVTGGVKGRNWWLPLGMVDFDKVLPGIVRETVRLLGRIHSLDTEIVHYAGLPTISTHGAIDAYHEKARAARDVDVTAALEQVAELMRDVEEREPRLLNGDADISNVLVDDQGAVTGWVDWDQAALGDPRWDMAVLVTSLRADYQMDSLAARAVADYARETVRPVRDLAAWVAMLAVIRWASCAWLRFEQDRGTLAEFPASERFLAAYDSHRAWALATLEEAAQEAAAS